jgi:hypothetical protein
MPEKELTLFKIQSVHGAVKAAVYVPNSLPGAWAYQGCYVYVDKLPGLPERLYLTKTLFSDVGRTLSSASYTDNIAMTVESCISFCGNRGYQYAGTEYYQECCKSKT